MRTPVRDRRSSLHWTWIVAGIATFAPMSGAAPISPPADHGHAPSAPSSGTHAPAKARPAAPSAANTPATIDDAHSGDSHADDAHAKSPAASAHKPAPAMPMDEPAAITADQAMRLLTTGNSRWVAEQCMNPNDQRSRRAELAAGGQHPYATILTCADSRLPAERIFDCGVGDIFVIRVAGNIMGVSETGTIEYGTEHLKTPLLVVMGHTSCGAVKAACTHAEVGGSIASLVRNIEPAVQRAEQIHPGVTGEALVNDAVRENVWQSIFDLLMSSEIARNLTREGELKIVGAVCDISTGKVEFLGEHPWQSELIAAMDAKQQQSPAHSPNTHDHPAEAITQANED